MRLTGLVSVIVLQKNILKVGVTTEASYFRQELTFVSSITQDNTIYDKTVIPYIPKLFDLEMIALIRVNT